MNLEEFCKKYNLGDVIKIDKLIGGLMHKMFKVETNKNVYAIKVLNPEVIGRPGALDNFLTSEEISNFVSRNGIDVSGAIKIDGTFVPKFKNNYYMVFKYIDGQVLKDDKITIEHCRKIGRVLAKIHFLDYKELGLDDKVIEDHFYVDWAKYINNENFNRMKYKDVYLSNYKKYYSILKRSVERYNESNIYRALCHRDMDPKNVMWVDDSPVIIDWESASVSNPYREVIEDALCWSGFLSNNFSETKFRAVLEEYIKVHNLEHQSYSIICGNLVGRLGWLDYNLKRSLGMKSTDEEEQSLAENEVIKTIDEINRYLELIGIMYNIICELTKSTTNTYDEIVKTIIDNNEVLKGLEFAKINAGFTNTIYKVGNYILRICTDEKNEGRFKKELAVYKTLPDIGNIPNYILSDTSKKIVPYYYEVIDFIEGNTLYEIWYKLNEKRREELVEQIVNVIKVLHKTEVEEYDFCKFIKDKLIQTMENSNLDISLELLLNKCDIYFKDNKFGLIHNDLHFDNFIYDGKDLYLFDFERCIAAPIDYDLRIFNRCNEEPWKWASGETDMLTIEDDFDNLMKYFISNYDDLREISYLKERLDIYKLIDYLNDYIYNKSDELRKKIESLIKKIVDENL